MVGIYTRLFHVGSDLLHKLLYCNISNNATRFFYACTGYFFVIKYSKEKLQTKIKFQGGMSETIYFVHMYFVAFCSLVLYKGNYHNFMAYFICAGGATIIALL